MTPEKFFDYLEGKLSPPEKERLERALISDPELQREFAAAREIHRGMQLPPNDYPDAATQRRNAIRGRQVAAAFAVLVALNVGFGLFFIFRANKPSEQVRRAREASLRRQVEDAVAKSAAAVFTPPTIDLDRITLTVRRANQDEVAAAIIAAAAQTGGSATKTLPNDNGVSVLALVPASREEEFRKTLRNFGAPPAARPSMSRPPNEPVHLEIVLATPH